MSFDHAVKIRRLANAPMSEAEWQVRCDLAACYRLACRNGWDDLIYTHISVSVPGPEHHFLTNPFGLVFDRRAHRRAAAFRVDLANDPLATVVLGGVEARVGSL